MKQKIYLYLFLFAALIAIFQFVNSKKILDVKDEKIESLQAELEQHKASSDSLINNNLDYQYFSLLNNDMAMSYLENQGFNAQEVANAVEDKVISQNMADENNPLVPFEGMAGKMRINKIRILNHKWLIADFTDGTYWGEVLLSYYFDEENNLIFNIEKGLLYPAN